MHARVRVWGRGLDPYCRSECFAERRTPGCGEAVAWGVLLHARASGGQTPPAPHPLWNSSTLKPTVGATSTLCLLRGCREERRMGLPPLAEWLQCAAAQQQAGPKPTHASQASTTIIMHAVQRSAAPTGRTLSRSMVVVLPLLSRPTTSTFTCACGAAQRSVLVTWRLAWTCCAALGPGRLLRLLAGTLAALPDQQSAPPVTEPEAQRTRLTAVACHDERP